MIILRELPREVILHLKKFRKLVENLKKKNVRFRWELPTGISFMFQGGHTVIKSEEEMDKFIRDNRKLFEN